MKRFILSVAALCAGILSAQGQNISLRGGISEMLYDSRYYPDLWGETSPRIPVGTLKIGWEDCREDPYAVACRRPEYGVALSYDPLGYVPAVNGPGCGSIYGIYGYFDRPIIRTRRFSLEYSGGLGLGFVFNDLYDKDTNPWNVVISIPVNARICLGAQAKYMISDRYYAGLGMYLNHCSNGLVWLDNYGYNAIEVGLIVGMKNVRGEAPALYDKNFGRHPYDDGFRRGFLFNAYASCGVAAIEAVFDRTKDVVQGFKYSFHTDALYRYCRTHATGIGLDLFVTPYAQFIADTKGDPDPADPVSVGVSITHEAIYHDVRLSAAFGRYLYHNDGIYNRCSCYQMVCLKYSPESLRGFFTGVVLKAHTFTAAESIQIVAGKRF